MYICKNIEHLTLNFKFLEYTKFFNCPQTQYLEIWPWPILIHGSKLCTASLRTTLIFYSFLICHIFLFWSHIWVKRKRFGVWNVIKFGKKGIFLSPPKSKFWPLFSAKLTELYRSHCILIGIQLNLETINFLIVWDKLLILNLFNDKK